MTASFAGRENRGETIMSESNNPRRRFLVTMGIAAGTIMVGGVAYGIRKLNQGGYLDLGVGRVARSGMPQRSLGKTGAKISVFGLGGEARIQQWHSSRIPFGGALGIIDRALDLGVNYIDTAPCYGAGTSERNIGRVLRKRRSEVFLATKTLDRTYDGTMRLAESSLRNLQTDTIDLYQVHSIETHEELDRIFAPDGAIKAMERLRDEGVVRFIGITGHHDPQVLLRGITEYAFDTILLPLNAADVHYSPFQQELLETAVAKEMGIIAMKVLAAGRLLRYGGITTMEQAMGYVLSFPVTTAIVGISSMKELEENVRVASGLEVPLDPDQLEQLEQLALSATEDANWFKKQPGHG
jgi:uncharacterized protein